MNELKFHISRNAALAAGNTTWGPTPISDLGGLLAAMTPDERADLASVVDRDDVLDLESVEPDASHASVRRALAARRTRLGVERDRRAASIREDADRLMSAGPRDCTPNQTEALDEELAVRGTSYAAQVERIREEDDRLVLALSEGERRERWCASRAQACSQWGFGYGPASAKFGPALERSCRGFLAEEESARVVRAAKAAEVEAARAAAKKALLAWGREHTVFGRAIDDGYDCASKIDDLVLESVCAHLGAESLSDEDVIAERKAPLSKALEKRDAIVAAGTVLSLPAGYTLEVGRVARVTRKEEVDEADEVTRPAEKFTAIPVTIRSALWADRVIAVRC